MMGIACLNCGSGYPDTGTPYRCPRCGGIFDDLDPLVWSGADLTQPGVWRYLRIAHVAGSLISLGEGQTPLLAVTALGREIYFKCEYANPTGSFKDRGTAPLISFLAARGVTAALEDSSGNAGASFAAYAARAGIQSTVFVPESASGPKLKQMELYGARVMAISGPRSNAAAAARKAADDGYAYASHVYLPHNLAGYATCAFEIVEQLRRGPGSVVVPAGQGGLLLGLGRGFQALVNADVIPRMPTLIGVQAAACAPLAALFEIGLTGLDLITEGQTVAEGVRVRTPVRAEGVIRLVGESRGRFLAMDENRILPARDALARLGFYVEPTAALVWAAVAELAPELSEPVVLVLTGSGYKSRARQEN